MDYLTTKGAYRAVNPIEARMGADSKLINAMNDKFLKTISSPSFASAREERPSMDLHIDKLTFDLAGELFRLGLAEGTAARSPFWIRVGPHIGLLYMSLLAKVFCYVSDNPMVPGTDEPRYEEWLFPRASKGERLACLDVTFQRMLPVPSSGKPLEDILEFRQKHRRELLEFRQELDRISLALASCKSRDEMRDCLAQESEGLELRLLKLKEALRRSGIKGWLGHLKTLVGVAGGVAGAAAGIPPVAVAGAAVAVAGSYREAADETAEDLANSPLSYVHHAKEAGILL
jgi:hypothetical protein